MFDATEGANTQILVMRACAETIEKVIHVGDTPMDVRAAKDAGALPLGVTTGVFTFEELHSACPDATIVSSLEGEDALKIFGLA